MRWSWKIARVAGIGVYLHDTFLILLIWVGLSHFLVRHNWRDAVSGLIFILRINSVSFCLLKGSV